MVKVLECFSESKKGDSSGGEDRLVLGPRYFGVVDGATDKSGLNWGTVESPKTGGGALADIIVGALSNLFDADFQNSLLTINSDIRSLAELKGIDLGEVNNRPSATLAVYDSKQHKVYSFPDCGFAFVLPDCRFEVHYQDKLVDRFTSGLRSEKIAEIYSNGRDPFVGDRDMGREFILSALERQGELQNLQGAMAKGVEWEFGTWVDDLAYWTIDGFKTCESVTNVSSEVEQIVFASDGFKIIRPDLEETLALHNLMMVADPMCTGLLKSTKGIVPGNKHYDDVSYLRIGF
jgi:hypothetical protein